MEIRRQVVGKEVVFYNAETGEEIKREPLKSGPSTISILLNIFGVIVIILSLINISSLSKHGGNTNVIASIIYGIVGGLILFAFARMIRLLEKILDK